jgi:hypothetical protein
VEETTEGEWTETEGEKDREELGRQGFANVEYINGESVGEDNEEEEE